MPLDGAQPGRVPQPWPLALDDLRPYLMVGRRPRDRIDGRQASTAWSPRSRARDAGAATVVCTTVDLARAMPAADLAARWRPARASGRVVVEPDPAAALDLGLAGSGPVVVAGSLYLVGVARSRLVDDPDLRDPDPVEDA